MICVRIYVHIETETLFPTLQYTLWSADSWPITALWKVYIIPLNAENITQHHTTQNFWSLFMFSLIWVPPIFKFQKIQLRNNFNSIEQILNSIQCNLYKDLDDMPQNYGPQNLVMPNARFQYPHTSQCWSVLGWIFPSFLDGYSNLGQHPYRHSLPLEMPTLQMTVGLEISANTSRKNLPHKTSNKASQCYE